MKKAFFILASALVLAFGIMVPASHASDVVFSFSSTLANGKTLLAGDITWDGIASHPLIGDRIPITSLTLARGTLPVTGLTCGSVACGQLAFTTGAFITSTSTSYTFAGGGSLTITGSILGGETEVLLSATFVGPVTVTLQPSGNWLLSGELLITSLGDGDEGLGPISGAGNLAFVTFDFKTGVIRGGGFNGEPQSVTVTANTVPEPASLALLGTGLLGLAGIIRRRKKQG